LFPKNFDHWNIVMDVFEELLFVLPFREDTSNGAAAFVMIRHEKE